MVVVVVGVWEGTLAKTLFAGVLGRTAGGSVTIDRFDWRGWGKASIEGITLTAPRWTTEGAQVARVQRIDCVFDPWSIVWGPLHLRDLAVRGVALTLVEDPSRGAIYNLQALTPAGGAKRLESGTTPALIDRASISDLTLSFARLTPEGATPTGSYSADFELAPLADDPSRSGFTLQETGGGVRIGGWIDQRTHAFSVNAAGVQLSRQLALVLPRTIRPFAERSGATGRITKATLAHDESGAFKGVCEFEDVRATLPNHLLGPWVRYERGTIAPGRGFPRFEIAKGSLEIDGPHVNFRDLDFTVESTAADGRVASLPVRASFHADLTEFQRSTREWRDRSEWTNTIADAAPFDLRVTVPNFVLGKSSENAAIELPLTAAKFLQTFTVQEMKFDLSYTATRAAPGVGVDGELQGKPITTSGTLVIASGTGAFDGFPYPLHNVAATVRFADDRIEIADLRGVAPQGDPVLMHGSVTNLSGDFGVDLSISASPAPVDAALVSCFPPASREFLSSLFWREGFEKLRAAGLIAGPAEVRAAELELPRVEARLEELSAHDGTPAADIADLASRAGRLRRLSQFGAFEPGGKVAFTLRVHRAERADAGVVVTGSIRILEGDILPTVFPYPVRVKGGEIRLFEDRVDFGEGVDFTTLGGSRGHFRGSIGLDQSVSDPTFRPDLSFALEDEQVNPLLVMAVPPAEDARVPGWPGAQHSEGGKLLSLLDIHGALSLNGHIGSTRDDDFDVHCTLDLRDGSLHPHLAEDDPLHQAGLLWPTGFGLDECHATVDLTDERVTVRSFAGLRGHGLIEASGFASMVDGARDLEVRLRHVDLSEYAVNLVPYEERARARELWEHYSPSGFFDADLRMRREPNEERVSTELAVRPKSIALSTERGQIAVQFERGALHLIEETVTCEALSGSILSSTGEPGQLCVDGSYGASGAIDLSGEVANVAIESPGVHELLRALGGTTATSSFDDVDPRGHFDASFVYDAPTAGEESFRVDAWINELSMGDALGRCDFEISQPVSIHLDPSGGTIDGSVSFIGGRAAVGGWLEFKEGELQSGAIEYDLLASRLDEGFADALPGGARSGLRAAGFSCSDMMSARAVQMFRGTDAGVITQVDAYAMVRGGSLAADPGIEELDGELSLWVKSHADATQFELNMDAEQLLLAGRSVRDAGITLASARDTPDAINASLRGALGTGRIEIAATTSTIAPHHYTADVSLAGCDLASLTVAGDGVTSSAPPRLETDPGLVEARFALGGDASGIASRRGRGSAQIRKADLARLPIALALLQVTQMSLALDRTVDTGEFDFTMYGPSLRFQRFNLRCHDLILDGSGWLDTQSGELALRLRNRGTMPILSDILGSVSNQLFQIDVRGTLAAPQGSIAPLPAIMPAPTLSTSPAAGVVR